MSAELMAKVTLPSRSTATSPPRPPFSVEASLTVDSNPAASTTEPYEVVKGILNIPFAVNIAYHYDEMAQLSDILLASNSVLERESVNCFEGAFDISTIGTNNQRLMMYRDPLPPIYNTRQPQDIIIELCDRMGMIDEFNANLNKVGVVRVDAEKCIGCQMCMNACPYDARSFFSDPNPTYWEEDGKGPDEYEKMSYKEHKYNTPDKCDFCVDRRAQGLPPACVATCAGKARIFGDMDDPNSEISKVIKKCHPKPLNPELKTKPHVPTFFTSSMKRTARSSSWKATRHARRKSSPPACVGKRQGSFPQASPGRTAPPATSPIRVFGP